MPRDTAGRRSARGAGAAGDPSRPCFAAGIVQERRGRARPGPSGKGGRKAAPRAAPGRAVPGARRGCRGGGAGRSAAPRAAAGSQGREGPAAGDFMGRRRRRREVGLAFRLPVPSAGRARGGRCAGQRGRGDSGDGKRQLGGDGSAGLTPSPPSPSRPEEDGARLVRACGRSSREQVRAATPPPAPGLRAAGGPVSSAQVAHTGGPAAAVSLPAGCPRRPGRTRSRCAEPRAHSLRQRPRPQPVRAKPALGAASRPVPRVVVAGMREGLCPRPVSPGSLMSSGKASALQTRFAPAFAASACTRSLLPGRVIRCYLGKRPIRAGAICFCVSWTLSGHLGGLTSFDNY